MTLQHIAVIVTCVASLCVFCYPQSEAQITNGAKKPVWILLITTPIVCFLARRFASTQLGGHPRLAALFHPHPMRTALNETAISLHLISLVVGVFLVVLHLDAHSALRKASRLALHDVILSDWVVVLTSLFPLLLFSATRPTLSIVKLFTVTVAFSAEFARHFVRLAPDGSLAPGGDNVLGNFILVLVVAIGVIDTSALHIVPWQEQCVAALLYFVASAAAHDRLPLILGACAIGAIGVLLWWHLRFSVTRMFMYLCVVVNTAFCVASGAVVNQWIRFTM
jgi:hypothetical protein